ncbi:hypothetical protein D3C76_1029290 [compost metagenome]
MRYLGAQDLQPANVHILEQRIQGDVGLNCDVGAVESDHDPVQSDLLLHGGRVALMEVRELGPGIDLGVRQAHIGLSVVQFVQIVVQAGGVLCLAIGGLGVGATSHRAIGTDEDFLALDLGHWNDVDTLQEVRLRSNRVVQLLGDRRVDTEVLADQVNPIALRQSQLQLSEHLRTVGAQVTGHVRAPAFSGLQPAQQCAAGCDRSDCSAGR